MSTSTDAMVFYGYVWDDESVDIDYSRYVAVEAAMKARGIQDPWETFPKDVSYNALSDDQKADAANWQETRKAVDAEFLVDVDRHCSHEAPMPFVYVRSTLVTAHRGSPKPVNLPPVDPAWKTQLDDFLNAQDVKAPPGDNQPGWWTCSWWG